MKLPSLLSWLFETNNEINDDDYYVSTNSKGHKIYMSKLCLYSYPCQHRVRFYNGDTQTMYGDQIVEYLKENGYSEHEHFEYLQNF